MKVFIALFFAATAVATVNQPLRVEAFSGYRNDRIHWYLKTPGYDNSLTYKELAKDVQFWTNGLTLKAIHRDLSFFLRGSYGAFGRGTADQKYVDFSETSSTSGWAADALGYFGYAVNLTADRTYKTILTPLIGYGAYWEDLHRRSGLFRQVWRGFFFGANFLAEPGSGVILNAGYAYNLLHNKIQSRLETETVQVDANGNPGQAGWMQLDFTLPKLWRLGFGADIRYFSSRVLSATITDTESEKIKLRWMSVSGWLQISKEL
jgi:hypothetical protein